MKVAVSAKGRDLDSPVDQRFGRAEVFIIFDTDTGSFEAIDNRANLDLSQGAGIQSARNVVAQGPQYLITGHCGPKAYRSLSAAGVGVIVGATGTVREALAKFDAGELKPADEPDVEGHWV
jgi:predicted Fe-Mo cluster-binding NifX family protein